MAFETTEKDFLIEERPLTILVNSGTVDLSILASDGITYVPTGDTINGPKCEIMWPNNCTIRVSPSPAAEYEVK